MEAIFLNLEKQRGVQNAIKKLIIDDTEVTYHTYILNHIKDFYEAFFKNREQKTSVEIKDFVSVIDVLKLSEDQVKLCEEDLTEKDLYKSLKSMQNDISRKRWLIKRILRILLGRTEGHLCKFRKRG